jgi:hypothetical protein
MALLVWIVEGDEPHYLYFAFAGHDLLGLDGILASSGIAFRFVGFIGARLRGAGYICFSRQQGTWNCLRRSSLPSSNVPRCAAPFTRWPEAAQRLWSQCFA